MIFSHNFYEKIKEGLVYRIIKFLSEWKSAIQKDLFDVKL